jgi:membrane associated rhomboid family serine protease
MERRMQQFVITPRSIKFLIYATCIISILCGLFDRFFVNSMGITSPQEVLELSPMGVMNGWVWQVGSYPFVHNGNGGITLFFLIELFFNMYILYFMGGQILAHIGERAFLKLYFFSSIFAGVIGSLWIYSFGGSVLAGPGPAIFAILTFWVMLHGDQELLLFFAFQIKARWLVIGLLGASLLIDLSHGGLFHTVALASGAFFGYLYGLGSWGLSSPFSPLLGVDRIFRKMMERIRSKKHWTKRMVSKAYHKAKVYDFRTGEAILDDEDFLDAMLTKISSQGEDALTRKERQRLRTLSEQKRKQYDDAEV